MKLYKIIQKFNVFCLFDGFWELIGFIIQHTNCTIYSFFRGELNKREFWDHCFEVSCRSIPTVIMTNISIGMVSSLQLTKHFQSFGVLSEIGGTNALALVRELSPVITSVVITGRVGSAWAAEIGTMNITEQVNALRIMKLSPEWFLICPRIAASMLCMPILNVISILASLSGAYIIAEIISQLGFLTFIDSVKRYVSIYDFFVSNMKSICFGSIIASIACIYGLKASGGASGVGKFTTKAVVSSLICLFAMNYFLSFIFYSLFQ